MCCIPHQILIVIQGQPVSNKWSELYYRVGLFTTDLHDGMSDSYTSFYIVTIVNSTRVSILQLIYMIGWGQDS